nr:30S ribosomal protein S2 [Anaerolineae bacterium]
MAPISMKALLETGVHFGHRTRKWNPKMRPYIFTERNGIHIIDLQQTLQAVNDVYDIVRDIVAGSGTVLFVGTKRQAQETIEREATRCGMPYVNERWLGGTLTNWRTIKQRIDYLKGLERRRDAGEFDLITKKEALNLTREIEKLNIRLGGIREMKNLPSLLFIVDVNREYTSVHEANILDIPIVAMVDTNCDPDLIDYIIPSNDDAIRAIKLMTSTIADAVLEGTGLRKDDLGEEDLEDYDIDLEGYGYSEDDEEAADEDFLGQATLAKLRSGELSFEEERKPFSAADTDNLDDDDNALDSSEEDLAEDDDEDYLDSDDDDEEDNDIEDAEENDN